MTHDAELVSSGVPIPLVPLRDGTPENRIRWIRNAGAMAGDVFLAIGVALCVPLIVLLLGLPIALGLRLLVWLAGLA